MGHKAYSIFNDVIGPVMTGPSSSHTAAPCKIGLCARNLLDSEPVRVSFSFNKGGSFAASYNMQGTDRGLVGGILGYTPDDLRLLTALEDAEKAGLQYSFSIDDYPSDHPNTVRIKAEGKQGDRITCQGKSLGGGMLEIQEIDGFPVSLNGKSWLLLCRTEEEETAANIMYVLQMTYEEEQCAISKGAKGWMILASSEKEPEREIVSNLKNIPGCQVKLLAPVFPICDRIDENVPFRTGAQMLEWAEASHFGPGEAGLYYEAAKGNITPDQVKAIAGDIIDTMERGIAENLASRRPGRLIKACSGEYLQKARSGELIDLGVMDRVIAYTMAMVERNSYYKTIVAAPTSGACGTVPGTIMGIADTTGADREKRILALLAAGAAGLLIAEQATFAAEECGCQAECGAASAMAAAAAVEFMGGSVRQAQEAASIALQNVLGMICDSVANLVEVPCLGRNVLGAVNAISAANMVMAGESCVIPLDETIVSMREVGRLMPAELCCTNNGGLAVTKTSRELEKKFCSDVTLCP